jgi:Ca2+-binding EF-hand superfamily protein
MEVSAMSRAVCLFGALVLLPVAASAQQPCTTDARVVVAEIHQRVLERSYDNRGAGMINRLSGGQTTVLDLVREVAKSPEYAQRFLAGDRQAAVTRLYKHLLARQPDPDGLNSHVAGASAQGFAAVIDSMLGSPEYQQNSGAYGVPGSSTRYCAAGEQTSSSTRQGQERFPGIDRNNDGVITRAEWNGTRESFVVQDWNGDDVLSGDEVRVAGRGRGRGRGNDAAPFSSWTEATFSNLDRNRDGRLSAAEWNSDTQSFVNADRNRDGALARTEFMAGGNDAVESDDQFVNLDANRNGRVERTEWRASDDAFDWLDRNKDGVLSRTEVVGRNAAGEQFVNLDTNRDGRLTLEEWDGSRRSFSQQDTNNDGALTRREYLTGGATPTTGR